MSYDPSGQSGSANVPIGVSTAGVYQGADISDNLVFPESGQVVQINAQVVFASGVSFASGATLLNPGAVSGATTGSILGATGKTAVVFQVGGVASSSGVWEVGQSGGGTANLAVVGSGSGFPGGSGGTLFAAGSGVFAPVGFFFIQVPTSGNPVVKVPFFNS